MEMEMEHESQYGLSGSHRPRSVSALAAAEATSLLASEDHDQVDNVYQRTAPSQQSAGVGGRPRQQSAGSIKPRKPSLAAIAMEHDEHVPHHPDDEGVAGAPTTKIQEVTEGVFLYTTQSTGAPPLIVTYRVETRVPEATHVSLSFGESSNIIMVPPQPGGSMEVHTTLGPFATKTLICSVRQAQPTQVHAPHRSIVVLATGACTDNPTF